MGNQNVISSNSQLAMAIAVLGYKLGTIKGYMCYSLDYITMYSDLFLTIHMAILHLFKKRMLSWMILK